MSNKNLYGKTILVGKEPVNGRLLVSVNVGGQSKVAAIGKMNSVPNSVSRCKPAENAAHCKIEVDALGNITVTNLKPQNITFVNGLEIVSKKVTADGTLELGKDHFRVSVKTILDAAGKIVEKTDSVPEPEEFSIRHLEQVWDVYNGKIKDIKRKQRRIGLWSSVPIVFSMLGGLIAGIAPEIRSIALTFSGVALVVMLVGFYMRYKDRSIDEIEEITEEFQRNYVCPKDGCHHFLGMQSYKLLRQNKRCPYCGCGFNEK